MFAGHFGLAAAIKSKESNVPLWSLMLSTQLLDVFFVPLYLTGVETMEPIADNGGYGESIIHADYTHSLLGALLIAVIAGLLARKAWGKRGGFVIAAVVFSHWLLDLLVHRSDMPIFPGNLGDLPLLGFGLWKLQAFSIGLELALIAAGAVLYFYSVLSRAKNAANAQQRESRKRAILAGTVMGAFLILSLIVDVMGIG
ncbi:permease [Paenibacillus sp. GCM10027626]|uniref:permease n=1 Tax=Paenibacillus sp. GCM10027626 TaxID=3273411 RepID=UPI00362A619C